MNRVQLRNNTWYFRARIPAPLQYLAPVKYFFRSLHTGNRKEALAKSLSHSYILDLEIKLLRKLDMLIKSGKIVLDKDDINKIIKYKLDQLTDALSDNYDDIVDGTFDKDSISVFKGNTSDDEHVANSMESVFREYITDLKDKPETHHSVIKQINRIIDTNMTLIQEVKSVKTSQKTLFNALKGVDKYTADMIECEHDDKTMDKWIHPMVNACLKSLSGKNNAQRSTNTIKTPWEDVFKEYALTKKRQSVRKLSDNTIIQNKTSIYTCFQMIHKDYIEDLNYKDCKKISRDVFNLPKKWEDKCKRTSTTLDAMLEKENEDCISRGTAKRYLITFKSFLLFCKKNHYLETSLHDELDIPKGKNIHSRAGFTDDELKKIFNPKTYPRKIAIDRIYDFWVPIIALYSGMRLNEICQLYIDDVVKFNKNIYYFNLTDERKDQHLKTKQSKRLVPIHPMIIKLGFLDVIKRAKTLKQERIFYQLKYSTKNHYSNAVSNWFQHYSTKIGIDGKDKVFHSFRHTVKQHLRDAGVPQEYQNCLCGWEGADTGETSYGGNFKIEQLYEYISMLQYPCLDKIFKKLKKD